MNYESFAFSKGEKKACPAFSTTAKPSGVWVFLYTDEVSSTELSFSEKGVSDGKHTRGNMTLSALPKVSCILSQLLKQYIYIERERVRLATIN